MTNEEFREAIRARAITQEAKDVRMGPNSWARLRQSVEALLREGKSSPFDICTERERLRQGYQGAFWVRPSQYLHIWILKGVPEGVVFLDNELEYIEGEPPKVSTMKPKVIPTTLGEAVTALNQALSAEDRACFLEKKGDFTYIQAKVLVLRWIRNEFGLWQESALFHHMRDLGYEHPDDMSNRILEEYIRTGGTGAFPTPRFDREVI